MISCSIKVQTKDIHIEKEVLYKDKIVRFINHQF